MSMRLALSRWFDTHERWLLLEGALLLLLTPAFLFPTFLPLIVNLLLVGLVLLSWGNSWRRYGVRLLPATPVSLPLLVLAAAIAVGILVSADPTLTLSKATNLFLGFAWWRLLAHAIRTCSDAWFASWFVILVGSGLSLLGALSTTWPREIPFLRDMIALLPAQIINLPSTPEQGVHTNQLAGTLLLFFPLLFSLLLELPRKSKFSTAVILLLTALTAFLLLFTQSRSGWLGGIAAVLLLLLLKLRYGLSRRHRLFAGGLLLILLIAGVVAALQVDRETLVAIWEEPPIETEIGSLATLNFRREVWRWAVVAGRDFPLTGTGLGSFRAVVHRLYPIDLPISYDIAHAHNIFLQVALDVGIPGLIAYLSILFLAAWMCVQLFQDSDWRPLAQGYFAVLLGIHIYGMTDALALGSKSGIMYWMSLGVVTGIHAVWSSSKPQSERVTLA
jgi:putative inorganic carbon (HCO3(-)) transporter